MSGPDLPDDHPKVEMHHAFFWICTECGERNWCEAMAVEDEAEKDRYQDQIDPDTQGVLILRTPGKVGCLKCGAWWRTETPGALEDPEGTDDQP